MIFSDDDILVKWSHLHKWPCDAYSCNVNKSCFLPNIARNKIKFTPIIKTKTQKIWTNVIT